MEGTGAAGGLVLLLGIGVILLVILLVLKIAFKLTTSFLKLGCLVISAVLLLLFFALLVGPSVGSMGGG